MKKVFVLTFEDFRAANVLASRTHKAAKFARFIRVGAPTLGAILVLASLIALISGNQVATESLRPCVYVGIGFLVMPLVTWYGQRQAYSRSFPKKDGSKEITITVSESGIACGMPGVHETSFGWSAITSVVEDKTIALIYAGQVNFLMLPKRVFTSQDIAEIRSTIDFHKGMEQPC